MKIAAIIQARAASSRLPGKVLEDLCGRPMLARVVRRTCRAALLDQVVVATSCRPADDPIARLCRHLEVDCFRGQEQDVLDRYYRAAEVHQADAVVRITADCPLIDPELIDQVVRALLDRQPDYAANTLKRTYPRGLDTEVVTAPALCRAWREATIPYQRVHVTPYIYQHPDLFRLVSVTGLQDLSRHRWTVDWPEDLDFVRAVYGRFGGDDTFSWRDVRQLLEAEPSLTELNRHSRHKELVEG